MSRFKDYLSDRRWVFLGIMALLLLLFAWKAVPYNEVLYWDRPVKMTLSKSRDNLTQLMGNRNVDVRDRRFIDVIAFKRLHELVHEHFGRFGIKENFYLDFDTVMNVKRDANFVFEVFSDDGFRILVDDREICIFNGPRSMDNSTTGSVMLSPGLHRLRLEYYQGGGELGLKAYYSVQGMSGKWLIGQSSEWTRFQRP
jgi:hypothetical protein